MASQSAPNRKPLAVVYEWMNVYGGSERLLADMLDLYPQAELYALLHDPAPFRHTPLEHRPVKTSLLQALPFANRHHRSLLPLMPFAIEKLNVRNHRVVISLSHAVSHAVKTDPDQIHIAYICTPMRYAWHLRKEYLRLHGLDRPLMGWLARTILERIRKWDREAGQRADHLLAISNWTAKRVEEFWGREAKVIYPPVDVDRFQPAKERGSFYLLVSRLVPYKMTAEIVRAFNQLKLPLTILGDGPEMPRLQKIAKDNIKLLGRQPDSAVTDLMSRARAFVYMAVEDFGIAMVEAQAAGCPVIAYHLGGAAEIVRDEETGILYREQTATSLMEAVSQFESRISSFDGQLARNNAQRFSRLRFREDFTKTLEAINQEEYV